MSQAIDRRGGSDRRIPFQVDEAKFSTQRFVTYCLLIIFSAVTANVLIGNDQAERSTILQTVINFTMLAIGFWLGTSKSDVDKSASMSRIAEAAPANTADAVRSTVAATVARSATGPPIPVEPVSAPNTAIVAEGVTVETTGDVLVDKVEDKKDK